MGFYAERVLPHVVTAACGCGQIMKKRSQIVPHASGLALEVGFGAGPNLQFYDPGRVKKLYALEPSAGMRRKAASAVASAPVPVEVLDAQGEAVPLDSASIDTVVLTFTACTIPDVEAAMAEMTRVLKPGGQVLFAEHGASPDHGIARWQGRIEPVWKVLAGGCHLTRRPDALLEAAGLAIERMETGYIPRTPKIAGFVYAGRALRPA